MLGFNWLKATVTQAANHNLPPQPAPAEPLPLDQQILQCCQHPITLGDLADTIGMSYRDLSPRVSHLIGQQQLKIVLIPRQGDGVNIVHFVISKL